MTVTSPEWKARDPVTGTGFVLVFATVTVPLEKVNDPDTGTGRPGGWRIWTLRPVMSTGDPLPRKSPPHEGRASVCLLVPL